MDLGKTTVKLTILPKFQGFVSKVTRNLAISNLGRVTLGHQNFIRQVYYNASLCVQFHISRD